MSSHEIYTLQRKLEENPDDVAMRSELVELLLQEEMYQEALDECQRILSSEPDNLRGLKLAIAASDSLGDQKKAKSFRRLYQVLKEEEDEVNVTPIMATGAGEQERQKDENVFQLRAIKGGRDDDEDALDAEVPRLSLNDVGGMEAVKKRLTMAFLEPYRNPMFRQMYNKSLGGGLLLYGPPGCGKTYIARALAGEIGARFINIGLTDVLSMWIGESERQLQQLFEKARKKAPAVIFIDEIDALGQKRSHLKHSPMRKVVVSLLAELDGWEDNNKDVFLIAATNHPWDVDPALRRPGRLDRTMLVLPPDLPARKYILDHAFKGKPGAETIDTAWLTKKTEGYSGADLVHLCDSAVEHAMSEAIETGEMVPVSMDHCKQAMSEMSPGCSSWFDTARNYAMYSNDEGTYDELLAYIKKM